MYDKPPSGLLQAKHLIDACDADDIVAHSTNDSRNMGAMAMDVHAVSAWRVNIEVGAVYVIHHTCAVHCRSCRGDGGVLLHTGIAQEWLTVVFAAQQSNSGQRKVA